MFRHVLKKYEPFAFWIWVLLCWACGSDFATGKIVLFAYKYQIKAFLVGGQVASTNTTWTKFWLKHTVPGSFPRRCMMSSILFESDFRFKTSRWLQFHKTESLSQNVACSVPESKLVGIELTQQYPPHVSETNVSLLLRVSHILIHNVTYRRAYLKRFLRHWRIVSKKWKNLTSFFEIGNIEMTI